MESFTSGYMFGNGFSTTHVVERSPPSTEIFPFEIPIGIVDRVMDNRYAGDGTVHPGEHLLYIKELCEAQEHTPDLPSINTHLPQ